MSHELPKILAKRWITKTQKSEGLQLKFSNGAEREFFRVHPTGNGSVLVVAVQAEYVVLTREYACGFHRYELGLPRGHIDSGESACDAALRELQEEAGLGARLLTPIRMLSMLPSYMSHQIHVVLAQDLYPSRLEGDEPEPIEVLYYPLANIEALALHPDFSEGRALGALLAARAWLQGKAAQVPEPRPISELIT
jgi:ADP-ribose diphosphatase